MITYILLVKCYALPLQDQELIIPLLNAEIVISRKDLFFQLYGNKNLLLHQKRREDFLCHIDMEAMIGLLLMIPTNELHDTYHQIWERDLWGNEFCLY